MSRHSQHRNGRIRLRLNVTSSSSSQESVMPAPKYPSSHHTELVVIRRDDAKYGIWTGPATHLDWIVGAHSRHDTFFIGRQWNYVYRGQIVTQRRRRASIRTLQSMIGDTCIRPVFARLLTFRWAEILGTRTETGTVTEIAGKLDCCPKDVERCVVTGYPVRSGVMTCIDARAAHQARL